ncbi:fructose-bisphosphate aldolase class I [Desulfopila sp. IMCC35006]|uniref:class I fructose-bisphosphate aldolase n=1 Tax=Desulfopila sp. IMCC35006 TaxID=2569542 RepID=UPI0010ADA451|nr:class I fructose-bisphosphate aldolase [Desulfopila sp. IMCC35006]TKB26193.1 fructose-bisphosphate aldolase class I [Desulfopila sp. IMCC35006]
MNMQTLESTARAMVAEGKGILAADESLPTIAKRLSSINVESTEEMRRSYRDLLFTAPGIEEHISGVILFDETMRQQSLTGKSFPALLADRGILPGIKVDLGLTTIPGTQDEKVTRGLDGLETRLEDYRRLGARFAKWRAVISIASHKPTPLCLRINAHALARYAAICQDHDLVPIVEPEVLINGGHDIGRCERAMEKTLHAVFAELVRHGVLLEGMILKPSMVTSGIDSPDQADIDTVARVTIRCFKRTVPAAVPGIAFLSGGQSSELATAHLNAMNRLGGVPWELSFSYGRALQEKTLVTWQGKDANRELAQKTLLHRAKCNGAARSGTYSEEMERS